MSRLRVGLIKDSLKDWLSGLLILSCESDILKQAQNEEIINKFAISTVYRKNLLYRKSFQHSEDSQIIT